MGHPCGCFYAVSTFTRCDKQLAVKVAEQAANPDAKPPVSDADALRVLTEMCERLNFFLTSVHIEVQERAARKWTSPFFEPNTDVYRACASMDTVTQGLLSELGVKFEPLPTSAVAKALKQQEEELLFQLAEDAAGAGVGAGADSTPADAALVASVLAPLFATPIKAVNPLAQKKVSCCIHLSYVPQPYLSLHRCLLQQSLTWMLGSMTMPASGMRRYGLDVV